MSKKIFKKNDKLKNIEKNCRIMISKKILVFSIIYFIIILLLLSRILYIQFIKGATYKEKAYKQQTTNRVISPKRGTIYDSTGKALARSAQVDTVSINPTKIPENKKELVAQGLSDIFELDYNETLEKVNSNSSIKTIAKKVEQEKIDILKTWISDNKITEGINIDEDSKRYYPFDNLASNLIGFCGDDNQGLDGLELKWNSVLTGTPRKNYNLKKC